MLSNVNFSPGIYVLFTVIVIIVTVAVTLYLGYRVIQNAAIIGKKLLP